MKSVCREFNVVLKEIDGEDDHVHLLVEYPPTVTVSRPGELVERGFVPQAPGQEVS